MSLNAAQCCCHALLHLLPCSGTFVASRLAQVHCSRTIHSLALMDPVCFGGWQQGCTMCTGCLAVLYQLTQSWDNSLLHPGIT
jgi:hypothetical protein